MMQRIQHFIFQSAFASTVTVAPDDSIFIADGYGVRHVTKQLKQKEPDDSIFIADGYGSNYVLKFDSSQKFLKAFGGPGTEEGKFKTCHGIVLDMRQGKPLLLVCNRNNNLDQSGNLIVSEWSQFGHLHKFVRQR